MKAKCAALLLGMLLLGATRAGAAPITYAVSEFAGSTTYGAAVAGSITTDGTIGSIGAFNIIDWNLIGTSIINDMTTAFFDLTGPLSGGGSAVANAVNITATPTSLILGLGSGAIIPPGDLFFTNQGFAIAPESIEFTSELDLPGPPLTLFTVCVGALTPICISGQGPSTTFADGKVIPTPPTATPLPAALPLFATGLGALGLLGWRRKRKTQAVAWGRPMTSGNRAPICKLASSVLAACALLIGGAAAANANPYVVTLEQVGPNVVATGSGAFDLTGLNFIGQGFDTIGLIPDLGYIYTSGTQLDLLYGGGTLVGPKTFGMGGVVVPNSSGGDTAGVNGLLGIILVPVAYVSGNNLSDSATYDSATFASLGVTPGTYVWTWGTGVDQSFTLEIGTATATPLPAALPLFATGLGALGLLGWRRKRKAQAVAA